ncbi:unnamed protein product [Caenorhabditis auriculariae]|uniref:C2H2-type domain-containing protein n=1 Tax=Caenorhabditis auriculariae TaxID=2777116 RepID=A0A8S1GWR7_9PELO|nr:unnamed protein product [Caenorhabditis auriculariae]
MGDNLQCPQQMKLTLYFIPSPSKCQSMRISRVFLQIICEFWRTLQKKRVWGTFFVLSIRKAVDCNELPVLKKNSPTSFESSRPLKLTPRSQQFNKVEMSDLHKKVEEFPHMVKRPDCYFCTLCQRKYKNEHTSKAHIRNCHIGRRRFCTASGCSHVSETVREHQVHLREHKIVQKSAPHQPPYQMFGSQLPTTKKFRDCKCARCVHPEAFGPDDKLINNYLGEESRRPALKEIVIQGGKKTASILLRSRNFKAPPSTEDLPDLGKENLFDELSDTNVENAPNFEINGNHIGDCEKRFYACEICGKGFTDSLQAQSHISGHKPNWLKCVFCGLSLNGRIALRQHYMSEHMDQSSSTFTCGGCFSVFPTRIHYEHHLLLLPEAHPCHVMDYRQDMYFDRPNISADRNPPVNISHASERVLPVFKQQNGGNPRDFKRLMVTPLGVRSMAEIEKNMKSFLMVKEKPPSTKPLSKDHRKTVLEMCKRVRQKPEENIPEIRIYKKAPPEEEDEEEEFEPYGRKNNVKWDELLCNEAAAREFPDWPAGLRKEFDNTKRPKEYCAFLREKNVRNALSAAADVSSRLGRSSEIGRF